MRDTTSEQDEIDRIRMIGGNHLANALIGIVGGNLPEYRGTSFEIMLHRFGQPAADMWVAWKAIMDLRDALHDPPSSVSSPGGKK